MTLLPMPPGIRPGVFLVVSRSSGYPMTISDGWEQCGHNSRSLVPASLWSGHEGEATGPYAVIASE